MKYVILIYHNEKSRHVWEALSQKEREEAFEVHARLVDKLTDSGELVASEALADPSHAKRLSVDAGRVLATDGPFAEAKEYLAGFYLIDCENTEAAGAYAAEIPEAKLGLVELRPVLQYTATDA